MPWFQHVSSGVLRSIRKPVLRLQCVPEALAETSIGSFVCKLYQMVNLEFVVANISDAPVAPLLLSILPFQSLDSGTVPFALDSESGPPSALRQPARCNVKRET